MSTDYSTFRPNADLMESMVAMGIDSETAKIALYKTGNQSCDAAIAYVFDNPLSEAGVVAQQQQPPPPPGSPVDVSKSSSSSVAKRRRARARDDTASATTASDDQLQPYKMVFVVNHSLEMGVGKVAAQVAHAALGLYRALREDETADSEALEYWEEDGERKIVLRGNQETHLLDLKEMASNTGLLTYLVRDAGLTEVAAGSVTVLGVFGQHQHVDEITGTLALL